MWLDNASEVDILFYEPYANVIADISKNPSYKPLTIGVFGVWGAGKSTLLKLIEQKIDVDSEKKRKTLCININAWTFEGYEDAKIALMQSLRKSPGLSGALIADTIQSSSSRIPEDMCRPNVRPADVRPSSMFWR